MNVHCVLGFVVGIMLCVVAHGSLGGMFVCQSQQCG